MNDKILKQQEVVSKLVIKIRELEAEHEIEFNKLMDMEEEA